MKFNKNFKDKETGKLVEANKPVEVTLKRADEIVENIKKQADSDKRFGGWKDFSYERVEEEAEADEEGE